MISRIADDETVADLKAETIKTKEPKQTTPPQEKSLAHSLFDSIKADRKLTFKSFRYRLLHWCFGINPKTPDESPLPKFLYTHFCPLFHLTNLIFIFSPVIFACKLLAVTVFLTVSFCAACWEIISPPFAKVFKWLDEFAAAKMLTRVQSKAEREAARKKAQQDALARRKARWAAMSPEERFLQGRKEAEYWIRKFVAVAPKEEQDFWTLMMMYGSRFEFIGEDAAKQLWNEHLERQEEAKRIAQRRKDKLRAWVVFWINFSRPFVKGVLYVTYVALAALVAYATVFWVIPALFSTASFIVWLASCIPTALGFLLYYGSYLAIIAGTVASLAWIVYKVAKKANIPFNWLWQKTAPPVDAVFGGVSAVGGWFGTAYRSTIEFVSLFYEENCPAVTIETDEEDYAPELAEVE